MARKPVSNSILSKSVTKSFTLTVVTFLATAAVFGAATLLVVLAPGGSLQPRGLPSVELVAGFGGVFVCMWGLITVLVLDDATWQPTV